jgi:tetratricopeptide (TPR) repeat protein
VVVGDSLRVLGDWEGAEREYNAALGLDDGICEAHYGLARVALQQKDPAAAENRLKKCKKKKYEGMYSLGMGMARFQQGKLDEAEILLIKAGAQKGSDDFRRDVESAFVDLYVAKDVPSLAVDHLNTMIELSPPSPALQIRKGRLLLTMRSYDDAVVAFREALAIDSTALEASQEVADLYIRARRPADAAPEYERMARMRNGVADWMALGEVWESAGDPTKAGEAYRKALGVDANADNARLALARVSYALGEKDTALAVYGAVRDSAQITSADYMTLGRLHLDRKAFDDSRSAYMRAAALDSTLADAYFYSGYTYFLEKKFKEAIPLFERRVALDSTSASTFTNLGIAYWHTDNLPKGIEMLEHAVRLRPEDGKTRILLAQALATQSRWAPSVEQYEVVIRGDSTNVDAWRGLGYSLLNQGRSGEAASALRRADGLDPGNVQGLMWLGQAYGMAGELERAAETFRRVLKISPASAEAQENLDQVESLIKKQSRRKRSSGT